MTTTADSDGYYERINNNPLVQQAKSTYDWTKHSCSLMENTLGTVENGVSSAAQVASQKALENYNYFYVRPREVLSSAFTNGKDKARVAVDTTKNAAVTTGTVGLGAAVVATQMGLWLSAGGAGLVLDTVSAAQTGARSLVDNVKMLENAVEKKLWDTFHQAQTIAMMPMDKAAETSHSLLDLMRALVERALDIKIEEDSEATVTQRVMNLARSIVAALTNSAHKKVIDPVHAQTQSMLDYLGTHFVIADTIREKKQWALQKWDGVSTSLHELKERIEVEAAQYKVDPEVMLMKSIRQTSEQLGKSLETLNNKGNKVLGDDSRMNGAISYLQDLDHTLAESENIYQVRDEVLLEAKHRFMDIASMVQGVWTNEKKDQ